MNWISIKNHLPQTEKLYLCATGKGINVLEYKKGEFYLGIFPFKGVDYWMDLPEAPKALNE